MQKNSTASNMFKIDGSKTIFKAWHKDKTPKLYEHSVLGEWSKLIKRSVSFPIEVSWKDEKLNNALHLVCRKQPPIDVICALIRAHPQGVSEKTVDGQLPIHFACFCGADETVITTLIEHNKKSLTTRDSSGETPLFSLCRASRSDIRSTLISLLLEYCPVSSSIPDNKGRTPVEVVFDDYMDEMIEMKSATTFRESKVGSIAEDLEDCMGMTSDLLRASYYGSLSSDSPNQILHAAAANADSPPSFIRYLLRKNIESPTEKDSNGRLAIHVAASSSPYLKEKEFGIKDASYLDKRIRFSAEIIKQLIYVYPDSVFLEDDYGKTPILYALESGKPWEGGLRELIQANPASLDDSRVKLTISIMLEESNKHPDHIRKEMSKTIRKLYQFVQELREKEREENEKEFTLLMKDWDGNSIPHDDLIKNSLSSSSTEAARLLCEHLRESFVDYHAMRAEAAQVIQRAFRRNRLKKLVLILIKSGIPNKYTEHIYTKTIPKVKLVSQRSRVCVRSTAFILKPIKE